MERNSLTLVIEESYFKILQKQGRFVSVHSEAILHTLENIYTAKALVSEIRSNQNR